MSFLWLTPADVREMIAQLDLRIRDMQRRERLMPAVSQGLIDEATAVTKLRMKLERILGEV